MHRLPDQQELGGVERELVPPAVLLLAHPPVVLLEGGLVGQEWPVVGGPSALQKGLPPDGPPFLPSAGELPVPHKKVPAPSPTASR